MAESARKFVISSPPLLLLSSPQADWSVNLGEHIIDIRVVTVAGCPSHILVLGRQHAQWLASVLCDIQFMKVYCCRGALSVLFS